MPAAPSPSFKGTFAVWRKFTGVKQTLHQFFPPGSSSCQGEILRVDGAIFYSWPKAFVKETEGLRKDGKHLLLVFDSFGGQACAVPYA